jgi:TetR/AcrR family transcriptional repressor of lmrAB and yxaGH operons
VAAGTRDNMIRSASALLRRHGVSGTSFSRVLDHSGAPRGSIGHHFPGGKTELLHAATATSRKEISARLLAAREAGADAAGLVRAICDYFGEGLARTGFRAGCPIAAVAQEAFGEPTLRHAADDAIRDWVEILADALEVEGRAPAQELATLAVTAIEGAIMLSRVRASGEPLDIVCEQLIALITQP